MAPGASRQRFLRGATWYPLLGRAVAPPERGLERGVLSGTFGGRGGASYIAECGLPVECQFLRLRQSLLGRIDVGVATGRDLRVYLGGAARYERPVGRDGCLERRGQGGPCPVGCKIVGHDWV